MTDPNDWITGWTFWAFGPGEAAAWDAFLDRIESTHVRRTVRLSMVLDPSAYLTTVDRDPLDPLPDAPADCAHAKATPHQCPRRVETRDDYSRCTCCEACACHEPKV